MIGTVTQTGGANGTVTVKATFSGGASGHVDISIPAGPGTSTAPLTVSVDPTAATCSGSLTYANGQELSGTCSLGRWTRP